MLERGTGFQSMPACDEVENSQSTKDDVIDLTSVWIIVPTLDEAENIRPLLDGIHREIFGRPYHVCIVDDGSKDGTIYRVKAFIQDNRADNVHIIERKKRYRGSQRGAAVLTGLSHGLRHSKCTIFVEMDADLSHCPTELDAGIRAIEKLGFDAAIASKYMPKSRIVNRPWTRRSLSFAYNCVLRILVTRKIRDFSNGYRFYSRACVEAMCAHRIRYGSPVHLVEVVVILLTHRRRIVEFPSTYVGRGEGISKLRWMDIIKAGIAIFEISVRYHLG